MQISLFLKSYVILRTENYLVSHMMFITDQKFYLIF